MVYKVLELDFEIIEKKKLALTASTKQTSFSFIII